MSIKEKIKESIDDPERLEELYQSDKKGFASAFKELYPGMAESGLSRFWEIRLDYDEPKSSGKRAVIRDIIKMIAVCLLMGFLIKIPAIFNIAEEIFYFRNASLIVFGGLILYVALNRRNFDYRKIGFVVGTIAVLTIYVNTLQAITDSDSINLVYIHLPILMWAVFGLVYTDFNLKDNFGRIAYIRYNGDLAVLIAIMVIAGAILSGITVTLFETIGINIEEIYFENVVLVGIVSIPVVATFITRNFPSVTNKIAPIIASIFSPLVLISASVFLVALISSGKNLFEDRDFLLIFNMMLLGVMAVIVFSVSETSSNPAGKFNAVVLFILSILTVAIDAIALSAIFYRLGAYGITPNRLAVLGSNVLILGNLVWLIVELYKVNLRKADMKRIERTIAKYLPVYLLWILFVVFGFPCIFVMR